MRKREAAREKELILAKASADGAGSLLLDVQQDCIKEKARADALEKERDEADELLGKAVLDLNNEQRRADALEKALKKLALAASKFRAATDHTLGWTDEHPHIKPFVKAMLEARAALANTEGET